MRTTCAAKEYVVHDVRVLFLFGAFSLAQAYSAYFICFGGSKDVLCRILGVP
jgi:hypothetical protein